MRLDLTQADRKSRDYDPAERFVVPRDVIDQAIHSTMSGDIINYIYDAQAQTLGEREW